MRRRQCVTGRRAGRALWLERPPEFRQAWRQARPAFLLAVSRRRALAPPRQIRSSWVIPGLCSLFLGMLAAGTSGVSASHAGSVWFDPATFRGYMRGMAQAPAYKPVVGALLKGYKMTLSPAFVAMGVRCRHEPSCAEYCAECVSKHGAWAGAWMGLARFSRCRAPDIGPESHRP
mgnify:CR=1 FL=1